jgi:hypothetical protein
MELIEGTDYCFIYPKDDGQNVHLKFLTGQYKDDQVYLLFAYDVLESTFMKPKKLEKDNDFKNYIGDLLVQLMSGNLEQDIIDETGTDDSQESDL